MTESVTTITLRHMIHAHLLSTISLFSTLDGDELAWLSEKCQMREFAKGNIVVNKDETSSDLMFLLQGQLVVTNLTQDGTEIGLHIIKPGSSFGEISAIDGLPRTASVKAMDHAIVGYLPRADFQELLLRAPQVATQLLQQFASVIRANNRQRVILSINNVQRRVAALLLSYSKPDGNQKQLIVNKLPTQHELAAMANTTRESVSRVINALAEQGLIVKKGRDLRIVQPDEMNRLIQNSEVKPASQ